MHGSPKFENNAFKADVANQITDQRKIDARIPKGLCNIGYHLKNSQVLEEFNNVADWTAEQCAISLETSNTKSGNSCLKVVPSTAGWAFKVTKTVSWDLSDMQCISFWLYIPDRTVFTATSTIYISSVSTWAKWLHYDFSNSMLRNGWNQIKLLPSQFISESADAFGSSMVTLRFSFGLASGKLADYILLDCVEKNKVDIPSVVLMFDDAWADVYNNAFPYMQARGVKGSTAVISNFVGTGSYMTKAQLQELYNAGWDICNHTTDHTDLSTVADYASAVSKIQGCKIWCLNNGFPRGSDIMINPIGNTNNYSMQAIKDLGFRMARTTIYDNQHALVGDMFSIKTQAGANTTTLATLKGHVDRAITTGSTVWVMIHKVSDDGNGLSLPISVFQGFMDYLKQKNVKTYTATEWCDWAEAYNA